MQTQFVFANGVKTTLAEAITDTDTSITLNSSANLPTLGTNQQMPLILTQADDLSVFEVVYVTAISGAVLTVIRAREGTTANSFSAGDYATCGPTAKTVFGVGADVGTLNWTNPASGAVTILASSRLGEIASVLDFGADPTGDTDSSTAFQNAINSGVPVYVPAGTYTIGSLLTGGSGLVLHGAGSASTIINATTNGFISVTLSSQEGCAFEGFTLLQSDASTTGGNGILVTASVDTAGAPYFRDVNFGSFPSNSSSTTGGFSNNASLVSTNYALFDSCTFVGPASSSDTTNHVTINGTSTLPCTQTLFTGCTFILGENAIYVGNGTTSYVQGVAAIGCEFISIHQFVGFWDNSTEGELADYFVFDGCLLSTQTQMLSVNNIIHLQVTNCYFLSSEAVSSSNPAFISAVDVGLSNISNNQFYAGNTTTAIGISVSGSATGGIMINNNTFFDFSATGAMPMDISSTGNTVFGNSYTNCNDNSIVDGNTVFDFSPTTGDLITTSRINYAITSGGTTPFLRALQPANGGDTIFLQANTGSDPTGYFLRFVNNANTENLFAVDVNGNVTVGNEATFGGSATFESTATFDGAVTIPDATESDNPVALGQVSICAPQAFRYGGGGTDASTAYGTTITMDCPTSGYIVVQAAFSTGTTATLGDITEEILVNGTLEESDSVADAPSWDLQAAVAVDAGSNTVTAQYVVGSTALSQGVFIRAVAIFVPNP